jgi:hypothetical protein
VLHVGARDGHVQRHAQVFAAARAADPPAPWCSVTVPGLGHSPGQSQHLLLPFYMAMIPRRLPAQAPASGPVSLRGLDQSDGWLGDPQTLLAAPFRAYRGDKAKACWFPDRYTALVWAHLARGEELTMPKLAEILAESEAGREADAAVKRPAPDARSP